ncbi:MAG: hypothetical protein LBB83_08220 [Treponema sp.]|nr:hypothetical protein [Treponema sp.]
MKKRAFFTGIFGFVLVFGLMLFVGCPTESSGSNDEVPNNEVPNNEVPNNKSYSHQFFNNSSKTLSIAVDVSASPNQFTLSPGGSRYVTSSIEYVSFAGTISYLPFEGVEMRTQTSSTPGEGYFRFYDK